MQREPIYKERYCVLVRSDHELAGAASVSWADAARQASKPHTRNEVVSGGALGAAVGALFIAVR